MTRKWFTSIGIFACLFFLQGARSHHAAQDVPLNLRVNVVLVQLNVAVTDNKGNYVTGLRPEDFSVSEDRIQEKVSSFEESQEVGHGPMETARRERDAHDGAPAPPAVALNPGDPPAISISRVAESNLFILFDTSNYMYRSFVFAQDAITELSVRWMTQPRSRSIPIAETFRAPLH